ncbi:MAG TPA: ABC transporter permease [Anaerolineales bacterium]|nr:ABC transporter permease [Anaerolineales bacterium]
MSTRWKKVWADFWGNKTRSILTILTIAVGTFAVGFTSNLGHYMAESMDGDYLSARPSEGTVYAHPLTDDSVKVARTVAGVQAVQGVSVFSSQLISRDGKKIPIQFTAIKDPADLTLNLLKPAKGQTGIPPLGEKQVLIDSSAAALGYKTGDLLDIELDSGKHRELRLTGMMHSPTGIPYNLAQTLDAYVTPDTMVWLGGSRDYNALAISVTELPTDTTHVTQVAQAVADRMKHSGVTVDYVNVYQPGHHFAYNVSQGMFLILGVLGWLTVLLSAFLIINTITALMTQQTRQIGIMKANGAGTRQLLMMYVVLISAFGAAALLISIPLANKAAERIGAGMAQYLNFYPSPYRGYTSTLVQQTMVAVVIPLLTALWPLYNSVRITVREALSDYGIGSNARPKDRHISRGTLVIPRPMRLSLRNVFRRKLRLVLTLFTLVLAGAIFISVYNLWAAFDKVINDIQGYFLADINISFDRGYRLDKVSDIALSVPGVKSVEGWLEYPGTLTTGTDATGRQILFVAPPSDSKLIRPIISSGRWLTPGDENAVVIGNNLLNIYPNLKVGDWLTIKINEKESTWHVIGTYVLTGNVNPPLLYTNYEYISRMVDQPGMAYSLRVITTSSDAFTQKRVSDSLIALFAARGVRVGATQLSADFIKSQTATTDIFVYFMLIMAGLIAIVGGLGLMGTMSINVLERTREIGVMRAIGASNWNIQSIVIVEGMVVGLISWVISIGLSIPITAALCTGVGLAILTSPMAPVFGITGIVVWLIGILVIGTLASALPAHRASSLTVRDTLAYE